MRIVAEETDLAAAPPMVTPAGPRLDALTGIRFFAAAAVVVRHFQGETFGGFPWFQRVGGQGYLAVGFFFVLSGFVLTYNYLSPGGDLRGGARRFWVARFARIYPAYLVAFLLSVPLFGAAISVNHGPGGTAARLVVGGTLVLLLIQCWTPWTASYVNSPAWSLSDEAFFYFSFPFCLRRLARFGPRGCLVALLALWAAAQAVPWLCCAWLGVRPFGPSEEPGSWVKSALQCLPALRLPEFLMGAVLGRYYLLRGANRPRRGSAGPLAAVALVLLALSLTGWVPETLAGNGLTAPLFLVLVWTLTTSDGLLVRFLSSRPIVWLGEISYGIYILQEPVCRWFEQFSGWTVREAFFLYCLVLIAIAAVCYTLIETPARGWIKARLGARRLGPGGALAPIP
jgi:peptidoglycan/LPS O-acetylase OafA/YrhL